MHRIFTGALRVEKFTIAIADLPSQLVGTTLVQLSDFHYDKGKLSDQLLAEAIYASNQAQPDLVLLTGDYITTDPTPIDKLASHLKQLQHRAGIYAILGNHDLEWLGARAKVTNALLTNGIKILWNQVVYPLGKDLALVGLADICSGDFNPISSFAPIPFGTPRIVLSHNPDSAHYLQKWRIDLQLSGHTHGGQIVLPGLGPVPAKMRVLVNKIPKSIKCWMPCMSKKKIKVVHHWEWSEGLHQVGTNYLYVNRGLGTYLPGRLFCPPEVTVITLAKK